MARFTLPRDLYHGKGSIAELANLKGKKAIVVVGGGNAPGSGCWGRSAGAAVPLSLVKILSLSFPAG